MRDVKTILAELKAARADYHEACQGETLPQLAKREAAIASIQAELVAMLTEGAKECSRCGNVPHGRIRTPEHRTGTRMRLVPAVYDVSCLHCTPIDEAFSGQGGSPELAVAEWNSLQEDRP